VECGEKFSFSCGNITKVEDVVAKIEMFPSIYRLKKGELIREERA